MSPSSKGWRDPEDARSPEPSSVGDIVRRLLGQRVFSRGIGVGKLARSWADVVGERLDCSGMRWIPERAEALLHLRCIELNGDWERFFAWGYHRWLDHMQVGQRVLIRSNQAEPLPTGASIEATDCQGLEPSQRVKAA